MGPCAPDTHAACATRLGCGREADVHHPRDIAGEKAQSHFDGDVWQALRQEAGRTHPRLERAEGMLDRRAPRFHGLGSGAEGFDTLAGEARATRLFLEKAGREFVEGDFDERYVVEHGRMGA